MKNTTNKHISLFQTSAFKVKNINEFLQQPSVMIICNAMNNAGIPFNIGANFVSFGLLSTSLHHSIFDDKTLITEDTIIELLELIEADIMEGNTCSVTYISSKEGINVNCYQMQIENNETTGRFVGIDRGNVFSTIEGDTITGVSPPN
ncbi:hypothetical protein A3Q34_03525 [Colwellia sp. PAMC 20917]|uniref:hypothetical protein n=1 Tax=Colwellia sp. PAMC 20917 TaxID=1816218 RepID=UPI000878834F|nr:hypothetical protein [Colwellia sp. PAMC 20917]AOW76008.1 hypothetical protein A3Q34_03525 [Colwellia sp. PAMC 20917]